MSIRTASQALAATYTTAEPSPDTPDGPQCLRYVWLCYGAVQSNLPPLTSVAFAKQGWIYSKMQHPGDRHPPAGAPVYFTGSDGHIAIATGNGEEVRSTEWPWGHVGTTTISAIERTWGRTYYGWTGDMLGHPITFDGASTAGTPSTPIESEIPLTPEQDNMLTFLYNAVLKGGPSMKDHGKSISQSLADINAGVNRKVSRAVNGKTVQIEQIQDNADTNTMVRSLVAQVAALQKSLALVATGNGADPAAVQAAAKAGAKEALAALTLKSASS